MTATRLAARDLPKLPIEAAAITPDRIRGRSEREISSLPVQNGGAARIAEALAAEAEALWGLLLP